MSPLWEVVGYGGLFLLALGLRLGGTTGYPLSPKEAEVAYAAWRLVQGAPLAATPTPLALDVAAASFFLFGASDLTARLGSVLLGSLVVPALALFRRELSALGGWGALGAAALAATSPVLIQSSRSLSAAAPALLLAVVGASLLLRLRRREGWAFWALAVIAGLLLNGGALGLGFILVGILFLVLGAGAPSFRPSPRQGLLGLGVLLATFYLAATTLTVNWSGVGLASLGDWNEAFVGEGLWGLGGLFLFASYEPLLLFLGVWGMWRWAVVWRRQGAPDLGSVNGLAALWFGVALIFTLAGKVAVFAPFLGLSLVLWGGPILVSWLSRLGSVGWGWEWGHYLLALAGLGLALLVASWLTLPANVFPAYYWLLILVGLAPALLAGVLLRWGRLASGPAWALGLAALLALTVHSAGALNYGEAVAEPLVAEAMPLDTKDMLERVRQGAGSPFWWTGAEVQLDRTVAQPWLWYLRDYPHVMLVEEAQGNPAIAILAPGKGSAFSEYRKGQGRLWVAGRGPGGSPGLWWRWLVFRQPAEAPSAREFEIFFRE